MRTSVRSIALTTVVGVLRRSAPASCGSSDLVCKWNKGAWLGQHRPAGEPREAFGHIMLCFVAAVIATAATSMPH